MRVVINGHDLPGRTCPQPGGVMLTNVHVGVQRRSEPVELVPGDADTAQWDLEVEVVSGADGGADFRGPEVHGKRGERFIYLTWGEVGTHVAFAMFRRAKLMLNRVDPMMIQQANRPTAQALGWSVTSH